MFRKDPFLSLLILFSGILLFFKKDLIRDIPSLIEYNTLIVLFTFMIITKGIEFSGCLNQVTDLFIERVKTERGLAFSLIFIELIISPFVTNDISLFLIIPITLSLSRKIAFDIEKLVIFEIWAANIGSSFLPIGNPQNIYIYQLSKMGFFEFIRVMVPFEVISAGLLLLVVFFSFKDVPIRTKPSIPIVKDKKLLIVSLFLLFLAMILVDLRLQIWAAGITVMIYLIVNMKIIYYGININLLLTFILLFILIGGIHRMDVIDRWLSTFKQVFFPSVLASQIISKVPSALLFSSYTTSYVPLLYGVNVAGNGTMISSLANLIGIRLGGVSTKRFHVYSLPFLFVTTMAIWLYVR